MELVKGRVVASRQGRDVTHFYVVAGAEKDRVLLCDGGKWTLEAPKRKNPRHLAPTGTVLPPGDMETDLKIKMALKRFCAAGGPSGQGG